MTGESPAPFDRDLALGEVLDPAKARRWAERVRASLGIGLAVADGRGEVVAAALGTAEPLAGAAGRALGRAACRWAADLDALVGRPGGSEEVEVDGFLWRGAVLRNGLDPLGVLILGPRLAAPGPWGAEGEALARIRPGTVKALLPPLRDSLEWILRAETTRCMVSDLHLEAVASSHRDLVEANRRLRESESRLEATVADLTRGVQAAAEETARAQGEAYRREQQAGLGRLASGVAHEINNPVAFVAGNLGTAGQYLAELRPVLDAARAAAAPGADPTLALGRLTAAARAVDLGFVLEDFPALLEEARQGADRIARIVRDLKDFSRVDCAEVDRFDLAESLRTAARLAGGHVPSGVSLVVDAPAAVPVWASGAAVHQALWNLAENALWAAAEGGTRVRLGCGADGADAWFEVEDDGPGVPEECLPLIFDPFFTTREVGEGAGLGLTVVRDVARAHGGRVEVFPGPGRGARFRVTLPSSALRPAAGATS